MNLNLKLTTDPFNGFYFVKFTQRKTVETFYNENLRSFDGLGTTLS